MAFNREAFAGLTIVAWLAAAGPAVAENVVRFTGKDAAAATMDPHSYAMEDNKGATIQVYEALLDVDSNLAVVPQLAVAWNIIDPTHWEFELRQGVRFHDGTPFTAEDVVFSIERAQADTSDFQHRVKGIAAVRVIDDDTVRITTTGPDPSLWLKLADVAVMSEAWAQEHDVRKPADFVSWPPHNPRVRRHSSRACASAYSSFAQNRTPSCVFQSSIS